MTGVLTPRQTDALHAVQSLTTQVGYPPTVREVAEAIGSNGSSTHALLLACIQQDTLQRKASPRTMVVTPIGLQLLNGGRR